MMWGRHPKSGWILSMAGLVAIAIMAFLWHLGSVGLVDETEPLFAEAARKFGKMFCYSAGNEKLNFFHYSAWMRTFRHADKI